MLARRIPLHAATLPFALVAASLIVSVTPALAAESPVARWRLESRAAPTNLPLQGEGQIDVVAADLGAAEVDGEAQPITITDTLPAGLEVSNFTERGFAGGAAGEPAACAKVSAQQVECTYARNLRSYGQLEILIGVNVNVPVAAQLENRVTVSGGEIPSASLRRPVAVNGQATSFGVESDALTPENEDGTPDIQAGSHPFQLTSTFELNRTLTLELQGGTNLYPTTPALAKDLQFKLPPGLIGNPSAIAQCDDGDFGADDVDEINSCPNDTVVGVATIAFNDPLVLGYVNNTVPLFNLVPARGEPAAFGFEVHHVPVVLDTSVRTGEDYGVTVSIRNIPQSVDFVGSRVTIWGVPGAASHNSARDWTCLGEGTPEEQLENPCTPSSEAQPPAFLTLPTSCTGPLATSVAAEAWNEPESSLSSFTGEPLEGLAGCNHLPFSAEIKAAPDIQSSSSPTGLTVSVHVPQEVSLNANTPAAADVKDTTVTLPEGVTLNPAGANNLEACSESQIGFEGFTELNPSGEPGVSTARFTPGEPSCPPASKIATATIHTPLLPNPLEGEVYLAAQNANPFGSLVAQYLVAKDPVSGVLVKLPGEVSLNGETGQITATFDNTPQLPFEELELHFFGGERAPLSTPAHCGTYTTNALFTPWSGEAAASSTSSFEIVSGPDGGPCPGASLPFAPSLAAGTTNNQAGAFSALDTTLGREDGNQDLQAVTLHFPPGFTGSLADVQLCGEAQANAGTCGPESLIGHTTVSVGLGGDPYTVTGGEVFITGPYNGRGACAVGSAGCAPFGLSIVNPAVAGPYNLGKVVVRAKIEVDPHTAALTVTTNGSGPYAIPHILDGIPLEIKHIVVAIDRAGFSINPTDCAKMAITGTLSSAEGASSPVSVPFQVTNCASLKFEPKFAVSTSGRTSKADGASLTVKLTYPDTPQGTEANVAKVKVDLPKQLPSRLTTLQKACLAKVFEANPASCPAASVVGHAKAITPILPVPLEGPAYFVSHGGEAFPSLIFVLQGYGVTEDLVATTFISKAGITSSTLKAVPDVPVGSFELNLPEEKYSALAANGNLCKSKLAMPTAFVGQNGAEIHTSTPISVTGCKPELGIVRHSVKGTKATIVVSVPSAGRLLATGKGVSTGRGKAGKAGDVSVKVTLTKAEQAFLKKYPSRKLRAKIDLRFTPRKGAKLTTSVTVLIA